MAELSFDEVAAKIKAQLDFECECKVELHEKSGELFVVAYFSHNSKPAYTAVAISREVMESLKGWRAEAEGVADFFAKVLAGKREDFVRDNP